MPSSLHSIFRTYDIRGVVGEELTEALFFQLGRLLAAMKPEGGRLAVGYDGRLSSPSLAQALCSGLKSAGVEAVLIGQVTTPMLYFAAIEHTGGSGAMVTGSHNPPQYNGLKMMLNGHSLHGAAITAMAADLGELTAPPAPWPNTELDIWPQYLARITSDIHLQRPLKVVVDAGNGVAGAFAPKLLRALGCEVMELFCEVDGHFPNHHPDPSDPHNLEDLARTLATTEAELGLAFDGDADRLGVMTSDGELIYPDRQLMLFAQDLLQRQPGARVLFDVKSSGLLAGWIESHGGIAQMCRTGHSLIKAEMKHNGALLAGEMSGHVFFKERWYGFDDGLYAACRLVEILSAYSDPSAVLKALPQRPSTPELQIPVAEGEAHALVQQLQQQGQFEGALALHTLDGVRAEFTDGFGLVRASNTTPVLVLRFEGSDQAALRRIQDLFRRELNRLKPNLAQGL